MPIKCVRGKTAPLTRLGSDQFPLPRRTISLVVFHRQGAEVVPLLPETEIVIGREAPADIVIADRTLSSQHARFMLSEGELIVEDLGSTNGTYLRGETIQRETIKPGEEVRLGTVAVSSHELMRDETRLGGLDSHDQFCSQLEQEINRAKYFGRQLSILFVKTGPQGHPDGHLSFWYPRIQKLLRTVDHIALYSSEAVELLLPETDVEHALKLAQRIVTDTETSKPPLRCAVAVYPDAATSVDQLLEVCRHSAQITSSRDPIKVAPVTSSLIFEPEPSSDAPDELSGPIVQSPAMKQVFTVITRLARSVIPVLLQGETGTGKEIVAREIHNRGPRCQRPMICVNCGAIPAQLVESTLFGHERGAFTGAGQKHQGVFEAGAGGTVLLDEIGELPAAAQVALLRVLETKKVAPVGSNTELSVNVRVLAATHCDLEAMCEKGTFRQDLLYRLNAMTVTVPPLRQRVEDIEALAARFLREANHVNGSDLQGIDPGALELLKSYDWPGNVRELRNAIERGVVIAQGEYITVDDLPDRVRSQSGLGGENRFDIDDPDTVEEMGPEDFPPLHFETPISLENEPKAPAAKPPTSSPFAAGGTVDLRAHLQKCEIELIVDALRQAEWNQTEAARLLSLPRRTLLHKMKTHGIKKHYGTTSDTKA